MTKILDNYQGTQDDALKIPIFAGISRRMFLKMTGAATLGIGLAPLSAFALQNRGSGLSSIKSSASGHGKAERITLLHTSDFHGQINVHDEFFWENGSAVFKKRGGFAHLKTMISELRKQNPNTLLLDGGDCFQGSGITALTKGRAMIPLMNDLNYDLVLPGNWEVVYGKKRLIKDFEGYTARKLCTNMFHSESGRLIFPPYSTFQLGSVKIGFIGYNDPLTPIRQSPDYSKGIKFTEPEENIASYIKLLREQEHCQLVFVMSHMGLAQQLNLASQPYTAGVDYILGGDTHERIREPLQGQYSKVTEPGAFASFVGKLDLVIEAGKIKEEVYTLLEVDPEKYPEDEKMKQLIAQVRKPYEKKLNRVIGQTSVTLMRYFVLETPMDNLITDGLIWKLNPDIAVSNGFRFCPPLYVPPGGRTDITLDYLYSMIPVDSQILMAEATGKQIWNWLEGELEHVFAKDPTQRLGGWLMRFQGMRIRFTIGEESGKRLQEVIVKGEKMDFAKVYTIASCEREGDPDGLLCRIAGVKNRHRVGLHMYAIMEEYLHTHSPVYPKLEGRAVATDASASLLTQVSGVNYQFR